MPIMGQRTPLYEAHLAAGGRLVDFAGWDLPVHYGSQVAEHQAVRTDAGMFDVSHMRIVDVAGQQAEPLLRRVLANDVARLAPGKALYSCMCNRDGGVVDDVIAYRTDDGFRVVVNAATAEKDLAWLRTHAEGRDAAVVERADLAMIAVQGPQARNRAGAALGAAAAEVIDALPPFAARISGEHFIARTGYTGEDGLEIMVAADAAVAVWNDLLAAGVVPAGLGARDTLRLEAGLCLYGNEMAEDVSPLAAGLGWTIAWEPADRDFVGRAALLAQRDRLGTRFVGLVLAGRGVMRSGQAVRVAEGEGVITSGTYSPTLGASIALARIPIGDSTVAEVDIRGRAVPADIVRPPFVRHGQRRVSTEGAGS
jgi:aminomethyltransferase